MKHKKLAPLLAVVMSLEMIAAPVMVHADTTSTGGGSQTTPPPKKDKGVSAAEVFNSIITVGQSIYQASRPQQMSPHMSGDMAAFQQQMTPQQDKYFNPQKLSKIPGLANYLAMNNINPQLLDCKTLPTTMHEAKNEVCRLGVTTDKNIPPTIQLNEMFTYYNQYSQINKMYNNYSATSNVDGQLFGIGCMKNAMNILNGFFQYRMNELDKLFTNLEAMNNKFKEASRADLDAIEEATAVLDGGDSDLVNNVKTKRPDLFDYGKRFDNPACKSMMTAEKFNEFGRRGLNNIHKKLKDDLTTPNPKFSGESYSNAHASVVEDINKLAEKVAKQMELNFGSLSSSNKEYGDVVRGMSGLSSSHSLNGALSPDLFSDLQTRFSEKNEKLQSQMADVSSELGLGPEFNKLIRNPNSGAFDAEVGTIETTIKNRCLRNSVNMQTLMDRIYDPSASKFANENASNFLKDKLQQIMDNDKTSLEKKMAELKALEEQEGGRYFVRMENSYEVQEVDPQGNLTKKVVSASNKRTPSTYLSDVIKNCEAQFKVNHLGNKMSGAQAIQKLRSIHQEYKSLAKSHAQEARDAIRKSLVECNNSLDANNAVVGSCTPDVFNSGRPGFCANAALSCSKNMQACTQQAEKFVTDMKKERTARVNNYKALVQKNKQDIVKIFDSALATYMRDGEMLRGVFGAGFSSPNGIEREVIPQSARFPDSFRDATSGSMDGQLLLEDPDKFMVMFKNNIEKLKVSVKQQQDQIMGVGGRGGLLADHIKQTGDNYRDVIRQSDQYANACIRQHDDFVKAAETQKARQRDEEMKRNQELGEKADEFCRRYSLAMEHPGPACSGAPKDLTRDVSKAVNQLPNMVSRDTRSATQEFDRVCNEYNNESRSNAGSAVVKARKICRREVSNDGNFADELKKLEELKAALATTNGKLSGANKDTIEQVKTEISQAEKAVADQQKIVADLSKGNMCKELLSSTCVTTNLPGQSVQVNKSCEDDQVALAEIILEDSGQSLIASADLAPAYCNAGNNDSDNPKAQFNNVMRTIGNVFGAGASKN